MKSVDDGGDDQGFGSPYNSAVGARLRNVRHDRRMTQFDVERLSSGEFKASVLGAYERGERMLSLPRLERLASLYRIPIQDLLPGDEQLLTERRPESGSTRIVLDLRKLNDAAGETVRAVKRFVDLIQVQRQDFNGRLLSIRHSDRRTLAAMLDIIPEAVKSHLEELDLLFEPR